MSDELRRDEDSAGSGVYHGESFVSIYNAFGAEDWC